MQILSPVGQNVQLSKVRWLVGHTASISSGAERTIVQGEMASFTYSFYLQWGRTYNCLRWHGWLDIQLLSPAGQYVQLSKVRWLVGQLDIQLLTYSFCLQCCRTYNCPRWHGWFDIQLLSPVGQNVQLTKVTWLIWHTASISSGAERTTVQGEMASWTYSFYLQCCRTYNCPRWDG